MPHTLPETTNPSGPSKDIAAIELQLRDKELDLRIQQDVHQYELAKRAQELNAAAHNDIRAKTVQNWRELRYFILALSTLVLCFGGACAYLGKEGVFYKLIEYAVIIFGSGGAGYYFKSRKDSQTKD